VEVSESTGSGISLAPILPISDHSRNSAPLQHRAAPGTWLPSYHKLLPSSWSVADLFETLQGMKLRNPQPDTIHRKSNSLAIPGTAYNGTAERGGPWASMFACVFAVIVGS